MKKMKTFTTLIFILLFSNLLFAFIFQIGNMDSSISVEKQIHQNENKDHIPKGIHSTHYLTVPPSADFEANRTSVCAGECVVFTDLTTNSPSSWTWTFDGGWPQTHNGQGPVSVCYITPGIYAVTLEVSNVWGTDIEIKTSYITVYPSPVIDIGSDTTICEGDTLWLNAGSGYFSYEWHPSGIDQTYEVTTSGPYAVTVVDANGCWGRDAINVVVLPRPEAHINNYDSIVCIDHLPFQFTAIDTGGVWSGQGITNLATGWFHPAIAGPGTHMIVYEIPGICGVSDTAYIHVVLIQAVNLGNDTIICTGDTLLLLAGSGYEHYVWSTGDTSQTISVTTSGYYSVTVSDEFACQASDTIYVLVTDPLYASIDPVDPFCANDPEYQLAAQDSGGVWSGNGITDPGLGLFDPWTAGPGIHQIIYHISGTCGDTDSISITVLESPELNIGNDTTICIQDSLILDAGFGHETYLWSTGDSSQSIVVYTTGLYSVTVSNVLNCFSVDTIEVIVAQYTDATILTLGPYCSNEGSVQLQAVDSGGVWFNPDGFVDANSGLFYTDIAGPGVHQIVYTTQSPCGDTDTVFITVYQAPEVLFPLDTIICLPDSLILDAFGGTLDEIYIWSTGDTTQTLVVTADGTYTVTVTNEHCSAEAFITVTFKPQLDATIYPYGPFCEDDDPLQFYAVDYGGIWYGTGITPFGYFSPVDAGPGDHLIMYEIIDICGDWDTIIVRVNESPTIEITKTDETCIGYNNGTATVIITGGTPPYSILWSTGETTETIKNLSPGVYTVTVIDANGCHVTEEVIIDPGVNCDQICIGNCGICNGFPGFFPDIIGGDGTLTEIKDVHLLIFSRWGEKIFESNDINNRWDGTYKGQDLEPAVFVFLLKLTLFDGQIIQQVGDVTLIR